MISFLPIWAVTTRHIYLWRRDINHILFLLYWPMLDILIWGFLGAWIGKSGAAEFQNYESAAILGILLWQVVGRGANCIAFAFCEELWSHNIINIFSLPLRTVEWILGVILYYVFALGIITTFSLILISALYSIPIATTLWTFFMFMPPLFFCCLWLGFTCLQIMVTMGKRGMELGFVIIWFLLPFSGAYYPIDVLPAWGKALSAFVPMSYVFTAMREYVMHQQSPINNLLVGYAMSAVYAVFAIFVFIFCFNRSKKLGLARLTD